MADNIRYYNFDIELIKKSVAAAILISFGVCINLTIGGITGAILFSFGLLGVCALKLNLFTGKAGYIFDSKENKVNFILDIFTFFKVFSSVFSSELLSINSAISVYVYRFSIVKFVGELDLFFESLLLKNITLFIEYSCMHFRIIKSV